MKTIKRLTLLIILTLTSVNANKIMMKNDYILLNDMNSIMLQEHQTTTLLKEKSLSSFKEAERGFLHYLNALERGDKILHLHGTNIPVIREQLIGIKSFWQKNRKLFVKSISQKSYQEVADVALNLLKIKLVKLKKLYENSYTQYRRKVRLNNIVREYIKTDKSIQFFNCSRERATIELISSL